MLDTVISVNDVSKLYKLYKSPKSRLKEAIHPFGKKYHREFYALKNISLDILKGESVGIIGKNGAGKSTLLKIITGVISPSSGSVCVKGKVSALLELGAGFNPEFTGIQNIYFYCSILGYSKKEIDSMLEDILSFADIGEFISQPLKTYSSGMKSRLGFAVAIVVDPDIMIVDEALSVGDIGFRMKCYSKFTEIIEKGKTLLFVTHSMDSIIKYCSRSIVINNGEIVAAGDSREMVDFYKKIITKSDDEKKVADIKNSNYGWKNGFSINAGHDDYGIMSAEIIDFGIFDDKNNPTTCFGSDETVEIRIKIKANKTINNPIAAYSIKDVKGNELVGTNTFYENIPIGAINSDEIVHVTFRQKVPLRGGSYFLSIGCTEFVSGELVVHHRLYDIIVFEVISTRMIPSIVDPHSQIEVSRNV